MPESPASPASPASMAERWGHHHISIMGIIAGMLLMAIVLI